MLSRRAAAIAQASAMIRNVAQNRARQRGCAIVARRINSLTAPLVEMVVDLARHLGGDAVDLREIRRASA